MRDDPGRLAEGLIAWSRGEDDTEAQAAAFRVATTVLMIERYLTKG